MIVRPAAAPVTAAAPLRSVSQGAPTQGDSVTLGAPAAPPLDLRAAMRVVEDGRPETAPAAREVQTWEGLSFAFRSMVSPGGTVIEADNQRRFTLWSADGQYRKTEDQPAGRSSVTPAFRADGGFYVSSAEGVRSYDAEATLLWEKPAAGAEAVLAAPDGRCFVTADSGLLAFGPDGSLLWERPCKVAWTTQTPVVGLDGSVTAADESGSLVRWNADGEELWRVPFANAAGRMAAAPDGTVLACTGEGVLHALGPDGVERWTYRLDPDVSVGFAPTVDGAGNVYTRAGKGGRTLLGLGPDGRELFQRHVPVAHHLSGAPGTGVTVGTPEGLKHFTPEGQLHWTWDSKGQPTSTPTWDAQGRAHLGSAKKHRVLEIPPAPPKPDLGERLQEASAALEPTLAVLEEPEWLTVGSVRLPVHGLGG